MLISEVWASKDRKEPKLWTEEELIILPVVLRDMALDENLKWIQALYAMVMGE